MIPYFRIPPLRIGSLAISPFVIAIIAGALAMHYRFLRRLPRLGLDPALGARMSLIVTSCTLIGAHFFDAVYEPRVFQRDWWNLWNGLSALGGVLGFIGGWAIFTAVSRISHATALAMFDAAAYCVPLGAAAMRLGCFAVHDHPGALTTHPLAVAFPDGARWDLGFLEALFWLALAAIFRWLDRKPRSAAFYPAVCLIAYSLFRLSIDPLRVDQVHFAGVSPDMLVATVLLGIGAGLAWRARSLRT